jgi:hypothetical protein
MQVFVFSLRPNRQERSFSLVTEDPRTLPDPTPRGVPCCFTFVLSFLALEIPGRCHTSYTLALRHSFES